MKLTHREIAIIETIILLIMFGAILIWVLFKGSSLGPISFLSTR